jgi:membrane protease YdiL (CAAX protease family)
VAVAAPTPGHPPLPGVALVTYVVLAFAFSWLWWVPMALRGQVARPGQGWPTHLPGLLGPALAAIVVVLGWHGTTGLLELGRRAVRWRGVGRWWWSVPAILALGVVGLAGSAATGTRVDLGGLAEYSGAPVVSVVLLFGYVLLVNGYGEELGWRGLLADGLVDRVGEVRAALLVTVVWATWHLPLFWVVEGFRSMGWATIGWVLGLLAGSVVLTRLYVGSGRSVLLVALWHTAFNVTTATTATQGLSAAITSTAVIVAAVVVLVRARARERAESAARAAGAAERRARLAGEPTSGATSD